MIVRLWISSIGTSFLWVIVFGLFFCTSWACQLWWDWTNAIDFFLAFRYSVAYRVTSSFQSFFLEFPILFWLFLWVWCYLWFSFIVWLAFASPRIRLRVAFFFLLFIAFLFRILIGAVWCISLLIIWTWWGQKVLWLILFCWGEEDCFPIWLFAINQLRLAFLWLWGIAFLLLQRWVAIMGFLWYAIWLPWWLLLDFD